MGVPFSKHTALLPLLAAMVLVVGCGPSSKKPASSSGSNSEQEQLDCTTPDGVVKGILPKSAIRKVIGERIRMIGMCVETYLKQGDSGRVALSFTIEPDGTVQRAEIAESTFENERFERCMVAAARKWRFPPPECGGAMVVTFPFTVDVLDE